MVRVTSLLLLFFHLLSWNSKAIEPDRGSLSVPVSIQVNLTCCGEILKGSFVQMQHAIFPDTVYAAVTDSTGLAGFPAVHQGLYSIVIKRFCYHPLTTVAVFTGPDTLSYTLNQVKKPIWGLTVHESTLLARWNPPRIDSVLLDEDWISGGFTANQWTVTGGSNWLVHPNNGHPRPAALFSWTPVVTNYEQFLTSRTIPAIHSNQLTLTYEIQLANFSPGQNLDVEISDGSGWQKLNEYNTSGGSIPWTLEIVNISGYAHAGFQIRFNSFGENSYNIQHWAVDNIQIVASQELSVSDTCIVDYSLTLNAGPIQSIADTFFNLPPDQVIYGQPNQVCVQANYSNGTSALACTTFTSRFLYIPRNFQEAVTGCIPSFTWTKPENTSGVPPPGILGYRLYRNGCFVHEIVGPEILAFVDTTSPPGFFDYHLTAIYDLISYGFPGLIGESYATGPIAVDVTDGCTQPLPFEESWDEGSFLTRQWTTDPTPCYWSMNLNTGNPAPSACYSGQPPETFNESALVSPLINGAPYNCGTLILNFDYKSEIQSSYNYDEPLYVEISLTGTWIQVAKFWQTGGNWKKSQIDLTPFRNHLFQIRFRVAGLTPSNPLTWFVDNIRIDFVCSPPLNFQAVPEGDQVNLTWSPPECGMHGSYLYYPRLDDTPETFFSAPPGSNIWVGTLFTVQNSCHLQDAKLWFHDHPQNGWDYLTLDVFDGTHTLIGSSDPFQPCSNDWMYVPLFGTVVEGDFFIMVHWDSATNPTHELGHDESNSDWAWEDYSWYFDGTTWSTYSSVVGCDTGVFFLRARVFNPDDKKSGELNNGHDLTCDASESMSLTGFDIYRTDESGLPPYSRLNLDPLSDTGYVDILPPGITSGSFRYYVTSVFHDPLTSLFICESSSDTILVDPYTGIYPLRQSILQMWPNPTTGNLSFLSKDPVKCVSLISALGIIYSCPIIKEDNCIYHIDISRHPSGIYLLHVATESGSIIEKVVKL